LTAWMDAEYTVARSAMDLPGLGRLTLYRTSMAVAKEEGAAPDLLPDLGLQTLIRLDKYIERVHGRAEVVYRITIKDDDEPLTAFAKDARQEARAGKDGAVELRVRAVR